MQISFTQLSNKTSQPLMRNVLDVNIERVKQVQVGLILNRKISIFFLQRWSSEAAKIQTTSIIILKI